jgi:hypothetical protein
MTTSKTQHLTTSGPVRDELDRRLINNAVGDEVLLLIGGHCYRPTYANWVTTPDAYPRVEVDGYISPYHRCSYAIHKDSLATHKDPEITNVIFNPPATIVFWSDKTKTVVKCDYSLEDYDPEKGIAMAISKKLYGENKYEYYNTFKHWLKKWDKQNKPKTEPAKKNTNEWTGDMNDA